MSINLKPADLTELRPRIMVIGVGGAGGNAVNNMIQAGLEGVEFIAANTDAQALSMSSAGTRVQMGVNLTEGLGAGSKPEIGTAAAEEAAEEIKQHLTGVHMLFITAGMGGGTGTGAAPVIARMAREMKILTVGVVTRPFDFEGHRRQRIADHGIAALSDHVDTIIVIPNQNLFRIANEKTTFADAFQRADDVLRSGVSCITDLMVKEGLINLDFADVRSVMQDMGTAMMGTGEAEGDKRALESAEAAISNPLLDDASIQGAQGLLISITGGYDLTLYEVEEAASRIRREVDPDTNPDVNIIMGAIFDPELEGRVRVSVVATGIKRDGTIYPGERAAGSQASAPKPQAQPQPQGGSLGSRLRSSRGQSKSQDAGEAPQSKAGKSDERAWQGSDETAIEARQPRQASETASGRRSEPNDPREPYFEPVRPGAPRRPPRRPLTAEDFPEFAGEDEGSHEPLAADLERAQRFSRKPGFFDWVTGRRRRQDSDAQSGASERDLARAPVHEPDLDMGVKVEELQRRRPARGSATASDSERTSAEPRPAQGPGADQGRAKATAGNGKAGVSSDEPFEIPDFFKRSLN